MRKTLVSLTAIAVAALTKRQYYLAAALAVMTVTANAQRSKCTDDPVIFTIHSSYTDPSTAAAYSSGILPDGAGPYVNGQQAVSAFLMTCNGSGHAFLRLESGTSRSIRVDLRNAVYTTAKTPSWANSVVQLAAINIWKVLYNYNPNTTYSFTTGMGLLGVNTPTRAGAPYYRMENPLRDPSTSEDPGANTPCPTALVHVTHYPATATSKETWVVWPDSAPSSCANGPRHVGTLFETDRNTLLNIGQFTTPFYIVIQRP